MNNSGSLNISSSLNAVDQHLTKKIIGKPWPKGVSGNPKGRRVGIPELNPSIRKKLKKQRLDNIAEVLIAGAERGEDNKIKTLLTLSGELNATPQVNITNTTNNASIITPETIDFIKQYLQSENIEIIDITPKTIKGE